MGCPLGCSVIKFLKVTLVPKSHLIQGVSIEKLKFIFFFLLSWSFLLSFQYLCLFHFKLLLDFEKCRVMFLSNLGCRYSYESLSSIPPNPHCFTERYLDVKKVLVDTFYGPPTQGVYSPSVQSTLYQMARNVLNRSLSRSSSHTHPSTHIDSHSTFHTHTHTRTYLHTHMCIRAESWRNAWMCTLVLFAGTRACMILLFFHLAMCGYFNCAIARD